MKIATVVANFPKISEKFILDEITGLIDLGHSVTVHAVSRSTETVMHREIEQYKLLEKHARFCAIPKTRNSRLLGAVKIILRYFLFYPKEILRCLDIKKYGGIYFALNNLFIITHFLGKHYDIIHCHFGTTAKQCLFLKDIFPVKFVTTFHGYDISSYVREEGQDCYQELFNTGDCFLAVSGHFKARLIQLGCPPGKAKLHYSGIKLSEFENVDRQPNQNGKIRILTVGRLVEKKGIRYALLAIKKLVRHHPGIEYTVIGDGKLKLELLELARSLNIQSHVRFLGALDQDEVKKHYQQSDIFVLPSITSESGDQEGIPNVIKEALATGLPVIATRHAGIPELIRDHENGFLVDEKDSQALGDRLQYLIEHPQARESMSQKGRELVAELFDFQKLNSKLEHIYEDLLTPI